MLSQEDKERAGALHNRNSEKTAIPLARWRMELGSLGWVVACGRGREEQEGRVHSVGLRSLNHTAEWAQASQRKESRNFHPCPTHLPCGWLVPHCRPSGVLVRSGLGWRGPQEARQQPILHLSVPALQAGVCRLQGWGVGEERS